MADVESGLETLLDQSEGGGEEKADRVAIRNRRETILNGMTSWNKILSDLEFEKY